MTDEEKKTRYLDMIRKADKFMLEYSDGYFAPSALFHKGYAEYKLGRYPDSIATFQLFLNQYPFHISAPGARHWIQEATKQEEHSK